jgi:MFS family permease
VWSTVLVGSAAINVAEVFFVKDNLGAGDIGFGVLIGASGAGLVIGSFLAAPALGKVGLRRHYAGSIALMAIGWGGAALSPSIWIAVPFAIGGAAGNGAAIICNQILVQRGAPDRFRGRALATIMSTNYVVIGLGMGMTGLVLNWYSARWIMIVAAGIFGFGALTALLMTRWLPVRSTDENHLLEAYGEAAAGELVPLNAGAVGIVDPLPPVPVRDGAATSGLERIAVLLEEIEVRREHEAARRSAS